MDVLGYTPAVLERGRVYAGKENEQYCSAIKRNEIMPFVVTYMGLEIVILSEVKSEKEISHDISYVWNLKRNDTN